MSDCDPAETPGLSRRRLLRAGLAVAAGVPLGLPSGCRTSPPVARPTARGIAGDGGEASLRAAVVASLRPYAAAGW